MNDMIRIGTAFIVGVIALFLGLPPLIKHFYKIFGPSTQEHLGIAMLLTNLIAIIIMVGAILFNNISSAKQISAIKSTTTEQVNAIKNAAQSYIDTMQKFDKDSKKALLSALLLEYESNLGFIKQFISKEKLYADEKGTSVSVHEFSFEAYQANLNNATIDDSSLLNKMVAIYGTLKVEQNRIDLAALPGIPRCDRVASLKKAIKEMKNAMPHFEALREDISKYKERFSERK